MSNMKKLLDIMNETTVSGSIAAGPAVGLGTQRRVQEEDSDDGTKAPDAPKAKEFGLWKNSVLAGAEQRDKKKSKKVAESKSEDRNEMDTPAVQSGSKKMAARHNNENWTKEQLADLGRRLAAVKTTRKNGYPEFKGIDKAIIRSKNLEEDDLEEGWKNKLAGAALAGAAALGGGGHAQAAPTDTGSNATIVKSLVNPAAQQRFAAQHADTTAKLSDPRYDHNPDALSQHNAYPKELHDQWIQNVKNAAEFDNPYQIIRIALNMAGVTPQEVLQNLPKGFKLPTTEPKGTFIPKGTPRNVNELDCGSGQRQLKLAEENISEEQLLAKELARRLDLFMKGLDRELGKKSSDRGIQSKTEPSTGAMREDNKSIGPDKNDPFEKGWRARYDDANPYSKGTKEYQQWQHGKDERESQPNHYDESVETGDESKDDINQIASQLKFLPTTKQPKQYKFVKNGTPGRMPAMTYTVSTQEQPVVTITSDGKETQNVAASDDIIMSGPSKENYVIKSSKFPKLYQGNVGGTVIPEQGPRLVALYTGKKPITFMASWGESMILKPGDYLVKDGDNYYRIAKVEYEQTYNQPGSTGQQDVAEESKGLWANIHAKQNRIKHGSGEHMRKPGSKGAPTNANFKSAAKTESVEETTGDPKFDKMIKGITGKKAVAKQQKADTKQQSRDAFSNMFGGGNPADSLGIRKKGVSETTGDTSFDSMMGKIVKGARYKGAAADQRADTAYGSMMNNITKNAADVAKPSANSKFEQVYSAVERILLSNNVHWDIDDDILDALKKLKIKASDALMQKLERELINRVSDALQYYDDSDLAEQAVSEDSDPCWDNYKQVGMKKKNGKKVPNCVPKEGAAESSLNEHGDPWEDPDYDPYGSGKETRSSEQIAKDRAEHAILSKKLGLSNKRDKDSMIGDMTKMLNHFMGQSSKKDVEEASASSSRSRAGLAKLSKLKSMTLDQQKEYLQKQLEISDKRRQARDDKQRAEYDKKMALKSQLKDKDDSKKDVDEAVEDHTKIKVDSISSKYPGTNILTGSSSVRVGRKGKTAIGTFPTFEIDGHRYITLADGNKIERALKQDVTEATGYKSQFPSAAPAIQYAKDKVKTFKDSDDGIEIWSMPDGGCDVVHTSNSNGRNHCIDNRGKKLGTIRPQKQVKETSNYGDLDEVAPPHEEKLVKKLKKEYPGHPEKAFATAWSIYNKKHGKK